MTQFIILYSVAKKQNHCISGIRGSSTIFNEWCLCERMLSMIWKYYIAVCLCQSARAPRIRFGLPPPQRRVWRCWRGWASSACQTPASALRKAGCSSHCWRPSLRPAPRFSEEQGTEGTGSVTEIKGKVMHRRWTPCTPAFAVPYLTAGLVNTGCCALPQDILHRPEVVSCTLQHFNTA